MVPGALVEYTEAEICFEAPENKARCSQTSGARSNKKDDINKIIVYKTYSMHVIVSFGCLHFLFL